MQVQEIVRCKKRYLTLLPLFLCGAGAALAFAFGGSLPIAHASTNIDSGATKHWAWNDVVGWIDFYNTNTITVGSTGLTGYASSSAGDVSLDCATTSIGSVCGSSSYQVNNDGSGNLSGWAWNDLYGWISFCGGSGSGSCPGSTAYKVSIDSNGNFSGYAWNDVVGWVSFNCSDPGSCGSSSYQVLTSWVPTSSATTTGILDSATFDTGISSGAQLNSFLWHGSKPTSTSVYFQFAVSNSSSGPWNFMGTDGMINTYYSPAVDTPTALDYSLFSGYRYFRYRVTLTSASGNSPRVDEVIVNWSP